LKRPFEFLASYYRATNAEVTSPSLWYIWNLSRVGWNQHEFRPPTGHPDVATYWANTNLISGFMNMALNALEDWNETAKTNLAAQLPERTARMYEAFQFWISRMQSADAPPEVVQSLMAEMGVAADAELPADPNEQERVLRGLVAAVSLTPKFLFR
jgi:Protein of unknown function (DUF1800)